LGYAFFIRGKPALYIQSSRGVRSPRGTVVSNGKKLVRWQSILQTGNGDKDASLIGKVKSKEEKGGGDLPRSETINSLANFWVRLAHPPDK
jgi:hypothetical protein